MRSPYVFICRDSSTIERLRALLAEHPDFDAESEIRVRVGKPEDLVSVLEDPAVRKIFVSRSGLLRGYVQEQRRSGRATLARVEPEEFFGWARAEDRFEREVRRALRDQEYLELYCDDIESQLARAHAFLGLAPLDFYPTRGPEGLPGPLSSLVENSEELVKALRGTVFGLELAA